MVISEFQRTSRRTLKTEFQHQNNAVSRCSKLAQSKRLQSFISSQNYIFENVINKKQTNTDKIKYKRKVFVKILKCLDSGLVLVALVYNGALIRFWTVKMAFRAPDQEFGPLNL